MSSVVPGLNMYLLIASTRDMLRDWGSAEEYQENVGTPNL